MVAAARSADLPKATRADARRSRAAVLETAQRVFATDGVGAPIDEIARRAGVSAATIYRHFPSKEALFEAVILDRLVQMGADAHALASEPDPGAAFFGFLSGLVEEGAAKRDLADALAGAGVELSRAVTAAAENLNDRLGELLVRAQAAGAVRSDVGLSDVAAVVLGCVTMERAAVDIPPGKLTALVLDCLRHAPNVAPQ
jgi:AcrR family transcriptional regulator